MRNGCAGKVHHAQVLASTLGSFTHCIRYSVGFAYAHTNGALLVSNHNGDAEAETTSAFDHFGNACNFDHAFFISVLRFKLLSMSSKFFICHIFLRVYNTLELQAAFARAIGQSLDTPDVTEATAIKYH